MLFLKTKCIFLVAVFLLFTFLLQRIFPFRKNDIHVYRVFKEACGKKVKNPKEYGESTQYKKKVSKDFWMVKDAHQRLHHAIKYDEGIVSFSNKKDLQESMHNLRVWLQDSQKGAMIQLNFLLANEGAYFYKDKILISENAHITHYQTHEEDIEHFPPKKENMHMQGFSKKIHLLLQKQIEFRAEHFKGQIYK